MTHSVNLEPVARAERFAVLDVLRGFALLGILLANVHYFSGWEFTEMMGTATPTAADHVVLWLTHLFITAKFYSVFSLLFGIGFFVFLQRAESKGIAAVPLFRRRLRWLLAIGLLHAFFLWAGDILTVYALLGFLLVPFRHSTDRALLRWAAVLLALPVAAYALMWAAGMGDPLAPPTDAAPDAGGFDPIAFMLAGFAGGYRDVLVANALNLAGRWVDLVITLRFPKVLAMFLIGFYVGRAGLARDLSAHAGLFRRVLIAGLLVGLPANIYLAWAADHVPYLPPSAAGFLSALAGAVGVPSLALAYAAGIALLARLATAGRALRVLAPVGRMALTNYLLQSLACAFIFYGYGLGLVGRTGPASAALIAVTIYAVQVPLSGLWLRHYAYGPMEWMWRRLTYRTPVPMRRQVSAPTISLVAALLVVPAAVGCTAGVTVSPRSHTQGGPSGGSQADLAITNVTVIDVVDGAVRPDQTVIVSGNRIAAVGPAGSTRPAGGARVVDARGKFLIPGLWDMHVHAARAERARRGSGRC